MDRKNGNGFIRDQRLQLFRIQRIGDRVDVAEHRPAAAADDGVRGGGKGEGRGDDLSPKRECLDHVLQRQMTVGEQGQLLAAEVVLQLILQLLVLGAHVGQPVAVP